MGRIKSYYHDEIVRRGEILRNNERHHPLSPDWIDPDWTDLEIGCLCSGIPGACYCDEESSVFLRRIASAQSRRFAIIRRQKARWAGFVLGASRFSKLP